MDTHRVSKGLSQIYKFPSPNNYIKRNAANYIKGKRKDSRILTDDEREKLKKKLVEDGAKRLNRNIARVKENLKLVQKVQPSHENYFIRTYFRLKHNQPENVSDRMAVVLEAGKYQCSATIKFLNQINASERNFSIRHKAFLILQGWGGNL